MQTTPALDALLDAQKIAFGPIAFQIARVMHRLGLFSALGAAGATGLTQEDLAKSARVSAYGINVLMRGAVAGGMAFLEDGRYRLTPTGRLLGQDELTSSNIDFVHDVCFKAMFHLEEAILSGKPAGIREIGEYSTIYEGLAELDESMRKSWLAWDHLYSDSAFQAALAIVFSRPLASLLDVGGNTGRWLALCAQRSPKTLLGMFDLPQQIRLAKENLAAKGLTDGARFAFHGGDILKEDSLLPRGYDAIWMSQFLDCFAPDEILAILAKAHAALSPGGTLYILEVCTDNQGFAVADYIVNMSSLYFTCIANGNSRFYAEGELAGLIEKGGFCISRKYAGLGFGHTLFEARRSDFLGSDDAEPSGAP